MTEERLPLNELLQKAGDGDFLRAVAESVLQLLMEADVEGLIGAGRHERAVDRLNWRNGDRTLDTRLGSLNLKIPKLRAGRYSRRSWRRARRRKRRWSPSSRRPGSAECRRAGSMRSRRRWGLPGRP
jgi:transposase-like protein